MRELKDLKGKTWGSLDNEVQKELLWSGHVWDKKSK